ncbi:MAG: hypothetical protein RBR28_03610 [Lentimicrobium sp.]|jgi:hypothetical protein|nr:hypothetical protein [Lentimicrobium sp.]
MKTTKLLFFLAVMTFFSCAKEDKQEQAPLNNPSVYQDEYKGMFIKEIEVTDENQTSTAFYRIYSDSEQLLDGFLKAHIFAIETSDKDFAEEKLTSNDQPVNLEDDMENYMTEEEPRVFIELVTANLEPGKKDFTLNVEHNPAKSTNDWIMGYPVGYVTTNNFIGVVHFLEGWEILVKLRYKETLFSSWKYYDENGVNSWWVGTNINQYWLRFSTGDYRKRSLVVYPHRDQQSLNYKLAYSLNEFRGRDCTIGSYDSRNCYIGTAPTGTTAFVWPNENGAFYYSPINGNQCPMPGSSFDGGNCYVLNIPSYTWGFTYQNKWYVVGNIIY